MDSKKRFLFQRRFTALKFFLKTPSLRRSCLHLATQQLYTEGLRKEQPIPSLPFKKIFPQALTTFIAPEQSIDGNMSYYELVLLSSFIKALAPKILLEIGTFNGLATLHMALNSSQEALIHTLDLDHLPKDFVAHAEDVRYILHPDKKNKKYDDYLEKHKIVEHRGNSWTYSFASFGSPEFVFIDGGHSHLTVKNDTEKSLNILHPKGIILWHDYTPDCPGVFEYLNILSNKYPLIHLEGSSLVYFKKEPSSNDDIEMK